MIGPSYALLETGSVLQATSSYGRSYLVSSAKKVTLMRLIHKEFVKNYIVQNYDPYFLKHKIKKVVFTIR